MRRTHLILGLAFVAVAAGGVAAGRWWAGHEREATVGAEPVPAEAHAGHAAEVPAADARRILYWYDPMHPQQRFDAPGPSPFMDMPLVPKYADETGPAAGVRINPAIAQNLGMRTAAVERGTIEEELTAVGVIAYDARALSVVQARAAGYVERVTGLAPGDVVPAGTVVAELLVPEWAGAQTEFLALLTGPDPSLAQAARARLRLLGMPVSLIDAVERSRTARPVIAVTTPAAGVIDTLEVRAGMTVAAGQTLATVRGLDPVWLDIAVPEASGAWVARGDRVDARLAAAPGKPLEGRVIDVLPVADPATRTFTVRVVVANADQRLRPGMYATATIRGEDSRQAWLVPSEAVIRTGRRELVMVTEAEGRYRPVEVMTGREQDGRTEVLRGLGVGDRVVTSGQFLIDSEARLTGILDGVRAAEPAAPSHEGTHR